MSGLETHLRGTEASSVRIKAVEDRHHLRRAACIPRRPNGCARAARTAVGITQTFANGAFTSLEWERQPIGLCGFAERVGIPTTGRNADAEREIFVARAIRVRIAVVHHARADVALIHIASCHAERFARGAVPQTPFAAAWTDAS